MEGAHAEGHLGDVIAALTAEVRPCVPTLKKHFLESPNGHCFTNHKTHKATKTHLAT